MNEVTSSVKNECERRLTNLYTESHAWLVQSAKRYTKQEVEAECLVSELYEYLHKKCNVKLFWGDNSYNLKYCSKFLHHRFLNKTTKLNRTTYVEEVWDTEFENEYDIERDIALEKAYIDVQNELNHLKQTKLWASGRIFEMYWNSDKTLDEVAKDIGISKSTTFLAVKKIRRHLKSVIDNPFNE